MFGLLFGGFFTASLVWAIARGQMRFEPHLYMLLTVFVVAIGDKIGLPWPALLTIITACAVFVPGLPQFEPPTELILPIVLPPLLWALARRTRARRRITNSSTRNGFTR